MGRPCRERERTQWEREEGENASSGAAEIIISQGDQTKSIALQKGLLPCITII